MYIFIVSFQLTTSLITDHVYSYLKTQRSQSDAEVQRPLSNFSKTLDPIQIAIKSANIFVDSLGYAVMSCKTSNGIAVLLAAIEPRAFYLKLT